MLSWTSDPMLSLTSPAARINSETQLLGKGGFGTVYRIHNKLDGQVYAVKRVLITENSLTTALREIRILASVAHPRVIRYHHSWVETREKSLPLTEDTDRFRLEDETLLVYQDCYFFLYLQMECCEMNLREFMAMSPPRVEDTDIIFLQVLEGLEYLHQRGIVHRDIKPDNILFRTRQPIQVKISDFGLAKVFENQDNTVYTGTYLYASPEQNAGAVCGTATDVYSLGIVLYEMGVRFSTEMERVTNLQRLRQRHEIPEQTVVHHSSLVLWMIREDPCFRPTVSSLRWQFDQSFHSTALWCRDIVWEIVYAIR